MTTINESNMLSIRAQASQKFIQFVLLTFLVSWAAWIPAALTGQSSTEFPTVLLHVVGGFGPSLVGVILLRVTQPGESRRDFWRRVLSFRKVSAHAWLVSFLLVPGIFVISTLASSLTGQPGSALETLKLVLAQPIQLIPLVILGIIGGPLAEELGWRGYGLDQLRNRTSPLMAALILAPVWWAWHLPLFFIRGTSQYALGIFTPGFWNFLVAIVPLTFLMVWTYFRSDRSILSAILIHFSFNFTYSLLYPLSPTADTIKTGLFLVVGAFCAIQLARTEKS